MRTKTLKEAAKKLNVTYYHLQKIRKKLNEHYNFIPEFMLHGTNGYKWSTDAFKKFM